MRILVTGGTGFLGGHLVRALLERGHEVRALVRRGSDVGRLSIAAHRNASADGATLVYGDLADPDSLRQAVEGVDAVYHLAAIRDKWGTPVSAYRRVNVEGTRYLLEVAGEADVHRFIYSSSVGVARYPGNLKIGETLPFREPTSQVLYHRSKAQSERVALEYARSGRVPAIVVRPVITYGPEDKWGMVTRLVVLLAKGRFVLVGNGRNHVDLAYIDDLIAGMCLALERGTVGRVYILSGTAPIPMRALVNKICGLLGKRSSRIHIPVPVARAAGWGMEMLYRVGDRLGVDLGGKEPFITRDKVATLTVDRGFSHARASRELGYRPRVDYDEGLRRTLDWIYAAGLIGRS